METYENLDAYADLLPASAQGLGDTAADGGVGSPRPHRAVGRFKGGCL